VSGNENKAYGTFMMIFDSFLYVFLFYYFDNVFPNAYGVKKPPCFCFQKKKTFLQGFEKVSIEDRDQIQLDFQVEDQNIQMDKPL